MSAAVSVDEEERRPACSLPTPTSAVPVLGLSPPSGLGAVGAMPFWTSDIALQEVCDVGPIVAKEIFEYFARDENLALVERLQARGLAPEAPPEIEIDAQPLAGETWVLTGTLEALDRKAAKVRLEALGAKVSGSVSAKTTRVVAGPGAGKKRADAERHGVPIFDEAEFLAHLAELEG